MVKGRCGAKRLRENNLPYAAKMPETRTSRTGCKIDRALSWPGPEYEKEPYEWIWGYSAVSAVVIATSVAASPPQGKRRISRRFYAI